MSEEFIREQLHNMQKIDRLVEEAEESISKVVTGLGIYQSEPPYSQNNKENDSECSQTVTFDDNCNCPVTLRCDCELTDEEEVFKSGYNYDNNEASYPDHSDDDEEDEDEAVHLNTISERSERDDISIEEFNCIITVPSETDTDPDEKVEAVLKMIPPSLIKDRFRNKASRRISIDTRNIVHIPPRTRSESTELANAVIESDETAKEGDIQNDQTEETKNKPPPRKLEVQHMPPIEIKTPCVVQKIYNIDIKPTGSLSSGSSCTNNSNIVYEEVKFETDVPNRNENGQIEPSYPIVYETEVSSVDSKGTYLENNNVQANEIPEHQDINSESEYIMVQDTATQVSSISDYFNPTSNTSNHHENDRERGSVNPSRGDSSLNVAVLMTAENIEVASFIKDLTDTTTNQIQDLKQEPFSTNKPLVNTQVNAETLHLIRGRSDHMFKMEDAGKYVIQASPSKSKRIASTVLETNKYKLRVMNEREMNEIYNDIVDVQEDDVLVKSEMYSDHSIELPQSNKESIATKESLEESDNSLPQSSKQSSKHSSDRNSATETDRKDCNCKKRWWRRNADSKDDKSKQGNKDNNSIKTNDSKRGDKLKYSNKEDGKKASKSKQHHSEASVSVKTTSGSKSSKSKESPSRRASSPKKCPKNAHAQKGKAQPDFDNITKKNTASNESNESESPKSTNRKQCGTSNESCKRSEVEIKPPTPPPTPPPTCGNKPCGHHTSNSNNNTMTILVHHNKAGIIKSLEQSATTGIVTDLSRKTNKHCSLIFHKNATSLDSTSSESVDNISSSGDNELNKYLSKSKLKKYHTRVGIDHTRTDNCSCLESINESLSEGEIRCSCSVSVGEVHSCKGRKNIRSYNYLQRPEKLFKKELGQNNFCITRQHMYYNSWISYYLASKSNMNTSTSLSNLEISENSLM